LKIFVATDQEASTISDFESMILNILPAMKRRKGLAAPFSLDTLTSHISQILEDFSTISPQYQAKNFGGFRSTGAVESVVGPPLPYSDTTHALNVVRLPNPNP
jgi:hypothetical protein